MEKNWNSNLLNCIRFWRQMCAEVIWSQLWSITLLGQREGGLDQAHPLKSETQIFHRIIWNTNLNGWYACFLLLKCNPDLYLANVIHTYNWNVFCNHFGVGTHCTPFCRTDNPKGLSFSHITVISCVRGRCVWWEKDGKRTSAKF